MKNKNFIYLPDWIVVLHEINKGTNYISDIHRKTEITYCHLHGIVKNFVEDKWISTEKKGRTKVITLTHLGKEIANNIKLLCLSLNIEDGDILNSRRLSKNNQRLPKHMKEVIRQRIKDAEKKNESE